MIVRDILTEFLQYQEEIDFELRSINEDSKEKDGKSYIYLSNIFKTVAYTPTFGEIDSLDLPLSFVSIKIKTYKEQELLVLAKLDDFVTLHMRGLGFSLIGCEEGVSSTGVSFIINKYQKFR